jgi:acetyl esterase/lipase
MNNETAETAPPPTARRRWLKRVLWIAAVGLASLAVAGGLTYNWWFNPPYERSSGVEYGRRADMPLTLDIFRPPTPNGAAVAVLISGSWKSGANSIRPFLFAPFLHRGYTVFAVRHQSQPACLIGDIVADMHRAIRFIRHHSGKYRIDPRRIGVVGASSGGHLALMLATQGDPGPSDADDPVDRQSSAVQCVACFFPATDLLNLGKSTENPGDGGPPKSFKTGFGPRAETLAEWKILGRELSPIYHITADLPPTLIVHGDADTLVPLEQSQWFAERARAAGGNVQLEVRPQKAHGWPTMILDILRFADWFDEHLRPSSQVQLRAVSPAAA